MTLVIWMLRCGLGVRMAGHAPASILFCGKWGMLGGCSRYLTVIIALLLVMSLCGSMALSSSASDIRGLSYVGVAHDTIMLRSAGKLYDFTNNRTAEYVAMLDDVKVIRVPNLEDVIPSSKILISGFADIPEAKMTVDKFYTVDMPAIYGVITTRD